MILSNFWSRVVAYSAILFFVFCKLPWLHCGFYWDESWVYGPAIRAMYHHGPSLLPNALPPDISRGHPLLFLAGCAAWMKVFGPSIFSMHCFALAVSVTLAIATFEIMRQLFDNKTAVTALVLLMLNVSFFTSAAYVMTDVAIALLALLTIYYWSTNRYAGATIALSMLLLTKEGGAMLIIALAGDMLINRSPSFRKQKLLTLFIATAVMALFYCTQKIMQGWYFFPCHISAINLGWGNLHSNIIHSLGALLIEEPVYSTLIVILLFAAIAAVARKKPAILLPLLVPAATYIVIIYLSNRDVAYYAYAILLSACFILYYRRVRGDTPRDTFIRLSFTFSLLFTLFSCVNFFETRYLFPVLFLFSGVLLPAFIGGIYNQLPKAAGIAMLLLLVAAGSWRFSAPATDLSQFGRITIHQQLVDYIDQNHLYDTPICSASFLNHVHLTDPNTGYLRGTDTCSRVTDNLLPATRIVIMDNIDGISNYDSIRTSPNFRMIQRFAQQPDWIEVWERK